MVDDGEVVRATRVRRIREGEKNSWIEIVLDEGKNRRSGGMLESAWHRNTAAGYGWRLGRCNWVNWPKAKASTYRPGKGFHRPSAARFARQQTPREDTGNPNSGENRITALCG